MELTMTASEPPRKRQFTDAAQGDVASGDIPNIGIDDVDEKCIGRLIQTDVKVFTGKLFLLQRKIRDAKEAVTKLEMHDRSGTIPASLKIPEQISLPKEAKVQAEAIATATRALEKIRVSQILEARKQAIIISNSDLIKLISDFQSTISTDLNNLFLGIEPKFNISSYIDNLVSSAQRAASLKLNMEMITKKKKTAVFEANRLEKQKAQEATVEKKDESIAQLVNRQVDKAVNRALNMQKQRQNSAQKHQKNPNFSTGKAFLDQNQPRKQSGNDSDHKQRPRTYPVLAKTGCMNLGKKVHEPGKKRQGRPKGNFLTLPANLHDPGIQKHEPGMKNHHFLKNFGKKNASKTQIKRQSGSAAQASSRQGASQARQSHSAKFSKLANGKGGHTHQQMEMEEDNF